ncbi:uncharacterized protein CLBA1 isoform X1 [Ailuropoda melanoleuca]|uniref:uncharacterized protein CLBA1 isoform X1 n=1 Tax=Ailuropoda melanoleuca TaxID=9646 RepID=UPI0009482B03|nr:uncharacterized protein CLBA1 isoform X1 [Ailuropoda melanoleuca]
MQGQRQRGPGPGQTPPPSRCPSDLAQEAGDISLCPASKDSGASKAPGGRRGAGPEQISGGGEGFSTCPAGGPDPGEHNSTWGEFEGFQESSSNSEQFFPNFERPERPPHPWRQTAASTQKERGSRQPPQGGPGVLGNAGSSPYELPRSYEDVFRFVFQEVPAEQATEGVSPLDRILEPPGCEPGPPLCSESRKLWRALQNTNSTSASRCLWSESRCQENLFLVLGIDAARKVSQVSTGLLRVQLDSTATLPATLRLQGAICADSMRNLSGDPGHILECSDLKEPEELGVPTFRLQPCRALIQTKLSGTSGGRQGSLLACSLFLKTPLCRNGQQITVPWKKKIFNPRNLKMTLFNSDIC